MLLLGTGRSGTTWLAGLLAAPFRYRLLFEPFHPDHVPGADLLADRYVAREDLTPEIMQQCQRALNDEIDCPWIAQGSNRRFGMHRWRFWPRTRICKSIRTNLFVPTYRAIFGDALPIVVLMRHPGAVVESFLRVRFPWAFDVERLLDQDVLQAKYGIPLDRLRRFAVTDVGKLVVRWVIENTYLLRYASIFDIHLVFYEDLVADPVTVISTLCAQLELDVAPDLKLRVSSLSYTTHPRSPLRIKSVDSAIRHQRIAPPDLKHIEEVLACANVRYPR